MVTVGPELLVASSGWRSGVHETVRTMKNHLAQGVGHAEVERPRDGNREWGHVHKRPGVAGSRKALSAVPSPS